MEVVKASDLPKAQGKFSKIISEHLYSVHKSLQDLELLASSDPGDVNYSAIKCDVCKERSDEEMQLLRWGEVARKAVIENAVNTNSTDLPNPKSKIEKNSMTKKNNGLNALFGMSGRSKSSKATESSFQKKEVTSVEGSETSIQDVKEREDDSAEKDKNSVEKSDGPSKDKSSKKIKNLSEENKSSAANSSTKKISPKGKSTKKKGLDNFFEKLTSPSQPVKIISPGKNDDEINTELAKERPAKEETRDLRRKKRNRSKDIDQSAKKRKRVIVQSDSSDSEVQSDAEMEDAVPELEAEPVDQRPKSPSPPRMKREDGKKKVLKLVNKVYKENGYIVTKKEHVYVSCSEDEEEKKEEDERRKMKKVEAKMEKVKKKQSTLTDFFKKS